MKRDTVEIVIKGTAAVGMAICIQLGSSLAQWANEDTWPSRINWTLIIVLAAGQGFQALWNYMSGSYAAWKQTRLDKEIKQ